MVIILCDHLISLTRSSGWNLLGFVIDRGNVMIFQGEFWNENKPFTFTAHQYFKIDL
jgi:hypothetical protein